MAVFYDNIGGGNLVSDLTDNLERLLARHPANVVRLDLPRDEPEQVLVGFAKVGSRA